jgi:sulfatase modifying factor 1
MTSHTFHKITVFACCCAFGLGCGKATRNQSTENRDSSSQSSNDKDTSTETGQDTQTVPEDTFATDPNCIHPEVVESCSNGWCQIPPGCFTAGSPETEMMHGAASEIQNQVTLTHPFEIQQFEVTQGQWADAGFTDPSSFGANGNGQCVASDCPVENINWYESVAFANRMSELHVPPLPACYTLNNCTKEVGAGMICETVTVNATTIYECEGYRLPTVYEAEYATRAGTRTAFYSGDITYYEIPTECNFDANLDLIAWYCQNSEYRTHPVGQKEPNGWGLYDMAGNVFEWVDSQFNGRNSGTEPVTDPTGPTDVPNRHALRGGAWLTSAVNSRAAYNFELPPDLVGNIFGTRLVRTL